MAGPGGLLAGLTKTVLETALEAEMTEHAFDAVAIITRTGDGVTLSIFTFEHARELCADIGRLLEWHQRKMAPQS